jgi:hypothetical protein
LVILDQAATATLVNGGMVWAREQSHVCNSVIEQNVAVSVGQPAWPKPAPPWPVAMPRDGEVDLWHQLCFQSRIARHGNA